MARKQRRHERYQVKSDAYAAFGRDYSKVGRIKDISLGGLSFTSINGETKLLPDNVVVAIYLSGNGFYLPDLPCRLLYRIPVNEYERIPHSPIGLSVARYGMEFGELNNSKKKQLEVFLESCATNRSA